MTKKNPCVGITLDWRASGQYSLYPWYALRQNYGDCLEKEGALPIPLPFYTQRIEEYLERLDGVLITGGDFDIDPSFYGEKITHERVATLQPRTQFEYELVKQALKQGLPVLGICGGAQLLNVVLGGSLIQHIPAEVKTSIQHEQPNPRTEPGHTCEVQPGTMLKKIVRDEIIDVNSAHHQAIKRPGEGAVVSALAPDGIIEAIEVPNYKFCMGVQWHPEYIISPADRNIFKAFVRACESS